MIDFLDDAHHFITFIYKRDGDGSYTFSRGVLTEMSGTDLMKCVHKCKQMTGAYSTVKIFMHNAENSYALVIDPRQNTVCGVSRSLQTLTKAIRREYQVNVVDVS